MFLLKIFQRGNEKGRDHQVGAIENRKVNNMYLFRNEKVVSNRSNFFERKVKTIVEVL